MKHYVILSALLCCTLLLVFHAIRTLKSNNENKVRPDENELAFYKMNEDLNKKQSDLNIPDINCISAGKDTIKLSTLINGKKILVFHFSKLNCNTCYEEELKFLERYYNNGNKSFIVLASYMTYRDFIENMIDKKNIF